MSGPHTRVYIGVGSNIEPVRHVQIAWRELAKFGQGRRASSVYQCEAQGFDGPLFYNYVIALDTHLSLATLKQQLRDIEVRWGRPSQPQKNQSRCLDLDILLYGDTVCEQPVTLPRPDVFCYDFVIYPLQELQSDLIIPGDGRTIGEIAKTLPANPSLQVVSVALD
ncbi:MULTISPECIES: 2-amino-4-hydroxy-6-hydroxymethyldihydropteridine diphosphokinase [unclassified Vibrio]|uniref:2-amino-4-hydroxy-6-hydroxymethyldihydropteridine diphosphokinase n=1 Tax=Vibrio sp. HB236076 TaxID=3232307 RepID=A0AB39HFY7_9VIBR|nr:2-amino-4-hydroxy-6-hydroxymethyldihydropteridine diphosphokinase [Vibrio sp. HB161653]MDP5254506.1 2-amino-4-hydroxy-6-hydroxymethyldihydropteridine diphosphokinase [Vibrio sp. HB161653]